MRRTLLASALALAFVSPVAGSARAEVEPTGQFWGWTAWAGTNSDGKPICGISARGQGAAGLFAFKLSDGDNYFTVQVSKRGWRIPEGTTLPFTLMVGEERFSLLALGDGDTAMAPMQRGMVDRFETAFRLRSRMTIHFQAGDEPDWTVDLLGSNAAANALTLCAERNGINRVAPTQPYRAPSATQPFGGSA